MVVTPRAALLILRLWTEGEDPGTLRVRITHTRDLALPGQTRTASGSPDDICAIVKDWLDGIARSSGEDSTFGDDGVTDG
ncbi:MAG TPA: hypothetical protein VE596_17045 [Gaiellaceae bacterium]|nr:hypothetical protein [Gaiellaceae bacterium]